MYRKIVHFDETGFNQEIIQLNDFKNQFQHLVNLYNSLDVKPLTKIDFWPFIFENEDFLFKALIKNKPWKYAGITLLSRQEIFKAMQKPTAYYTLLSETKRFIQNIEEKRNSPTKNIFRIHTNAQILKFFDLDSTGLIIKPGIIIEAQKLYELYETIF